MLISKVRERDLVGNRVPVEMTAAQVRLAQLGDRPIREALSWFGDDSRHGSRRWELRGMRWGVEGTERGRAVAGHALVWTLKANGTGASQLQGAAQPMASRSQLAA